jgi:hypothetical protein
MAAALLVSWVLIQLAIAKTVPERVTGAYESMGFAEELAAC